MTLGGMSTNPLKVALIGCGALSEQYYAPTLQALSARENLQLTLLIDPKQERLGLLGSAFPSAQRSTRIVAVTPKFADLAIVASPPHYHADQAEYLLAQGLHVLCEKPMATSTHDARRMVESARHASRLLSVGLFRRFFPSTELVHDLILGKALGAPVSFEWSEGSVFNWPATSASFFQRSASGGGVLADAGTHVLDLLLTWFGTPEKISYYDDALGGLEANASLNLNFPHYVTGSIRLSRDTSIPNLARIRFERGTISFSGASAHDVVIDFEGCRSLARAKLHHRPTSHSKLSGESTATYQQAFIAQMTNFVRSVRGEETLRTSGADALLVQLFIEDCYASRQPLPMPWASSEEEAGITLYSSITPAP
jgi:predicted dehydrogenase